MSDKEYPDYEGDNVLFEVETQLTPVSIEDNKKRAKKLMEDYMKLDQALTKTLERIEKRKAKSN